MVSISRTVLFMYAIPAQKMCGILQENPYSMVRCEDGTQVQLWELYAIKMHEHVVMTTLLKEAGHLKD